MNLIDELRMLAEDLYVNGYNRYSTAMSNAADEIERLQNVEIALREIEWSNDSKWQADRARSVLEKSK